jgi:hypothetical protein
MNIECKLICKFVLFIVFFHSSLIAEEEIFGSLASLNPVPSRTGNPEERNDFLIAKRLLGFYQRSAKESENRGNSMWQAFFNERHLKLHQIFMQGDVNEAIKIFRNPASTDLLWGIDNLTKTLLPLFVSPEFTYRHALLCLDGLVRFGEAVGALLEVHDPWTADAVVERVEAVLGQEIFFPNPYPDEDGVLTAKGVVSYRAPQALYQAWRMKQLLKDVSHPRVLEIGAGLGRTAYYAKQFGIEDYTIVDLPFTSMSSGYFLSVTLGEDKIVFSGENSQNPEKKIKIISPEDFFSKNDAHYDLVINIDSLTEMDLYIAQKYWEQIQNVSDRFLSINHEANSFTVQQLIKNRKREALVERQDYYMRKGYFEELVDFLQSKK